MDDKAQVSVEYLVIVSVLIVIVTIVVALGFNINALKEGIKTRSKTFIEKALEMIK